MLGDVALANPVASQSRTQPGYPSYNRYQLHPAQSHAPYDMSPPGLIKDGEEGYASQPQSPLDMTFPMSISSTLGARGADPLATICRSYVDAEYPGPCQYDTTSVTSTMSPLAGGASYGHGLHVSDGLSHPGQPPYVSLLSHLLHPGRSNPLTTRSVLLGLSVTGVLA